MKLFRSVSRRLGTGTIRLLPEALFEVGLIIFAVLVALGVDQYRENRQERQLAATALDRIETEIRSNRTGLLGVREDNVALLADLDAAVARYAAGEALGISGVRYEVSLLGLVAWETAQTTGAVQFIEFDTVSRISEVYRTQQLYLDRQDQIVTNIASIGGRGDELRQVLGSIRGGLSITLKMECALLTEYGDLLEELPGERPEVGAVDGALPQTVSNPEV